MPFRFELPLASPTRDRSSYVPKANRATITTVTEAMLAAETLADAGKVARNFARRLPKDDSKLAKPASWKRMVRILGKALEQERVGFGIIQLKGNVKLPFATFSTLPKYTCPGAGECVDFCYSFKSFRYPGAWSRMVQNTLFLKGRPDLVKEAFLALPQDVVFRLYVDGDFDSYETVAFWMRLMRSRPDIKAYGYSKSWDLIREYADKHGVPENYSLNLSSGGGAQRTTKTEMLAMPFVRGEFLSIPVHYRPTGKAGNIGFERYDDPKYHQEVRAAATKMGLGKVFSCPGKCGECASGKHACGSKAFSDIVIVNGLH